MSFGFEDDDMGVDSGGEISCVLGVSFAFASGVSFARLSFGFNFPDDVFGVSTGAIGDLSGVCSATAF